MWGLPVVRGGAYALRPIAAAAWVGDYEGERLTTEAFFERCVWIGLYTGIKPLLRPFPTGDYEGERLTTEAFFQRCVWIGLYTGIKPLLRPFPTGDYEGEHLTTEAFFERRVLRFGGARGGFRGSAGGNASANNLVRFSGIVPLLGGRSLSPERSARSQCPPPCKSNCYVTVM
eukprot:1180526-Prorocentrum_minimum.AAC.2